MTSPLQEKITDVDKARDDLIDKFQERQRALKENAAYYDAQRRPEAIGVAVPVEMQKLLAHVGYPRLYVDAIAERQELEGFRLGGKDEADQDLRDWWQANDLDIEAPLGHTDALMHGAAYITVAMPDPKLDFGVDPEVPIIRVEPPTTLYADIDPRTRQVSKAIRVIYGSDGSEIEACSLYLTDRTIVWLRQDGELRPFSQISHGLEVVPVVPILNRTRLSDPHGSSQITPELRSATDAAGRILMLMQGAAEAMGVPLRLLFGVKAKELGIDPDTGVSAFDAYYARILGFEEENGKAFQFTAAELRNFVDALREIAFQVVSMTGLPPNYLATTSENPASAEAMRALENRLIKTVERKNLIFGGAWEQAMRIAYKAAKGGDIPPEYYRMEAIWRDPATPTYAAKADAAAKLYGNGSGVIPRKRAWVDMGYTETERDQMEKWAEEENPMGLVGTMYGPTTPALPGSKATPAPVAPAASKESAK